MWLRESQIEEVQGRAGEGLAEEHGALSALSMLPEPPCVHPPRRSELSILWSLMDIFHLSRLIKSFGHW